MSETGDTFGLLAILICIMFFFFFILPLSNRIADLENNESHEGHWECIDEVEAHYTCFEYSKDLRPLKEHCDWVEAQCSKWNWVKEGISKEGKEVKQ